MFFFYFKNNAVDAFREAAAAENLTHDEVARRIDVSRATISKFIAGRPLSPELLKKLVAVFPGESGRKILLGHFMDEVHRVGLDPESLQVIERNRHSYLLEQVAKLVDEKPDRAVDLVKLIDSWQRPS